MIHINSTFEIIFAGRHVESLLFSRVYIFGLGNFLSGYDKIEPI